MRALYLLAWFAVTLSGCGTTIKTLRVPLQEESQPLTTDVSRIDIRDLRPEAERQTHTGKVFSCDRWYGDDTFVPARLEYLKHLLAARMPPGERLEMSLEQFDIVEYCEDTASRAGAAAATGASYGAGNPTVYVSGGVPGGDSVLVRVVGRYGNADRFDISRRFDYSDLTWKFTELPAANVQYRERLRKALAEIADELLRSRPEANGRAQSMP